MDIIRKINSARSLNKDNDKSKFQYKVERLKPTTPTIKNEVKVRPAKTMVL